MFLNYCSIKLFYNQRKESWKLEIMSEKYSFLLSHVYMYTGGKSHEFGRSAMEKSKMETQKKMSSKFVATKINLFSK